MLGRGKLATVIEEKGKELGAKLDEIRAHVLDAVPSPYLASNHGARERQAVWLSGRTGSAGISAVNPTHAKRRTRL
jgi:hypothetical protein